VAIRRLYHNAKLVHSDLSEYNILVSPMSQVENALDKREEAKEDLQIVLIDFGQAVERRHPQAGELLLRDLTMIKSFFDKQGITTLSIDDSEHFVLKECMDFEGSKTDVSVAGENDQDGEEGNNDSDDDEGEEDNSLDDNIAMDWIEAKLNEIRFPMLSEAKES
jgi:serine/threonine-protein kinase RIO1